MYDIFTNLFIDIEHTDVGNATSYTFSDLPSGSTYYFTATAYDASNLENDYSDEAIYMSPAANQTGLLWRHNTTGENLVWYMNGVTKTGTTNLPSVNEPNWQIVGR